jgi:carbonic anhydrase/acetyltransferase-like protein (isoleucine patch superfamily)
MWAGAPARFVREVKPEELKAFADAVERYAGLGEEYRTLLASTP